MKNVKDLLVEGKVVEVTSRLAHTPDKSYTMKNGYAEKTYQTVIHTVEDRGAFYYVGHTPVDRRNGGFGYFRVFKNQTKRFGIIDIKEVR